LRYRNCIEQKFTLDNDAFEFLLNTIPPEKIVFLFKALLLEQKIIIVYENYGEIAIIIQALTSLLAPL
jgi:hypothetical protein